MTSREGWKYADVSFVFLECKNTAETSDERNIRRTAFQDDTKLSLCLTKHNAMKIYWGVQV